MGFYGPGSLRVIQPTVFNVLLHETLSTDRHPFLINHQTPDGNSCCCCCAHWGRGGRSGTVCGRSPQMLCWVLPKRIIAKPDQHRKDIIQQETIGTDRNS